MKRLTGTGEKMAKCRSCGTLIVFGWIYTGRIIPLERKERGDEIYDPVTEAALHVAMGTGSHVSHFERCPAAAKYGRNQSKRGKKK